MVSFGLMARLLPRFCADELFSEQAKRLTRIKRLRPTVQFRKEVFNMTKLVRFSPRADLSRMQRDFDHIFSNFFPTFGTEKDSDEPVSWNPRIDVIESTDAYELAIDVPGVEKDAIQINLHEGVLSISGEREARTTGEEDNVVRLERHTGRFYRSFSVPTKIADKKIEARHENGVLVVRIPKLEETKPRKIVIK